MSRGMILLGAPLAALVLAGGAQAAGGGANLAISVDRASVSTQIGRKFVFRSTIANHNSAPATGLIAHLNVLSLRSNVYVDPEDWSSNRVRYLAPIAAGGSTTITWHMHAVNGGRFAVYVTVIPETGGPQAPTSGPTINLAVAERKTLNSGGILPLALGIPALLGFAAVSFRLRRGV